MSSREVSSIRQYSDDAALSPIRERTRNAIAQHRALRKPDQRRTYTGTSESVFDRPYQSVSASYIGGAKSSMSNYIGGNISDAAASIYEDIESSEQHIKQLPKQPQYMVNDHELQQDSILSISLEGHLQQMENMFLSPSVGATLPAVSEPTHHVTSYREAETHPSRRGLPYSSEVVAAHVVRTEHVPAQNLIVFRDDESTFTGMSQQELIRKKARSVRRKRLSSKPRKPIIQLPPQMLLTSRISAPQRQFYHTIEKPTSTEMSKRSRWNKTNSNGDCEDSPDMELSSATAEMTNESGESMQQRGNFAAASATPSPSSRRQPVLAVRGDDALFWVDPIDQQSLGDESFPVPFQKEAPRNAENEDFERFAFHRPPLSATEGIVKRLAEAPAQIDVTPSGLKAVSVRFADTYSGKMDDESSMPWDQKTDLKGSARSPASVLEDVEETKDFADPAKPVPKSILRNSRYKPMKSPKPNPVMDRSPYEMYDEPERLLYTLTAGTRSTSDYSYGNDVRDSNAVGERQLQLPTQNVLHVDEPKKSPLKEEMLHSRSLSPPRNTIGLLDMDGLELSPIRPNRGISDVSSDRDVPELELRKQMATILAMRDGEIADRVIEEGFPDPPLEIDMDDDETVLSAYVFIETVAAIVIQTAIRQFLAVLLVDSMRQTRDAMAVAERVLNIEESCLEESLLASSKGNSSLESPNDYLYTSLVDDDLDRVALDLYELAAIQIQATYRGFWVRDCLDVDHYCATVLQRMYRGLSCRKMFARSVKRVIIVQSLCRRHLARNKAADILTYVIIVQAAFRGYLIKKRYRAYRKKVAIVEFRAAATIQARWRAFVCEAYFIRTLVDVLIVQTVVRKWLARRKRDLALKEKQQISGQARSAVHYQGASPVVRAERTGSVKTKPTLSSFIESPTPVIGKERAKPHSVFLVDARNESGSREGSFLSDDKWTTAAARCLTSDSKKAYVKSKVVAYPHDGMNGACGVKSFSVQRKVDTGRFAPDVESTNRNSRDDVLSSNDSHILLQSTSTLVSIWKEKERQNGYVPRNVDC